jgi:hypothetical protein
MWGESATQEARGLFRVERQEDGRSLAALGMTAIAKSKIENGK